MQIGMAITELTSQFGALYRARIGWGWTATGLVVAFLLFDSGGKVFQPKPVVEAFEQTGWPLRFSRLLGVILLVCTVLYVVPQTSLLGCALLTGYLGGAVATNLRLGNPVFSHTLFPVYFGILIWVGLWLREPQLAALFPIVR